MLNAVLSLVPMTMDTCGLNHLTILKVSTYGICVLICEANRSLIESVCFTSNESGIPKTANNDPALGKTRSDHLTFKDLANFLTAFFCVGVPEVTRNSTILMCLDNL